MDYADALRTEDRIFGELIRSGDPATPVPTCPEWNLKQLFRHVGRGHRWTARIIEGGTDQPPDPRSIEGGKPPSDPDEAVDWLREGGRQVIDAVEKVGPSTPVWTFWGPKPAGFWLRRRLHEVTVHRADAALALGGQYAISPELAADAVSEWFDIVVMTSGRGDATNEPASPLAPGQTMHLHATDPDLGSAGEWTISAGPEGLSWLHDHGKGAVALRGPARDLLLATMRRAGVSDLDIAVFGDQDVWQRFLDRTPF